MNIKINKTQFEYLLGYSLREYVFGSRLYGTENEKSDTDVLVVYKCPFTWTKYINTLPNFHMFQYDDVENNKQYIFTTEDQFVKNQQSGDAVVNSEIILFTYDIPDEEKLALCRTYKVIKSFLGFAKRDANNNRNFHANRCMYIAACLLDNIVPNLDVIKSFVDMTFINGRELVDLRNTANKMYDDGELHLYYIPQVEDDLLQILLNSNNIKEFKY